MKIDHYPQPQRDMLGQSGVLNRERYVLMEELTAFAYRKDLSGKGITYDHQNIALSVVSILNFLAPAYLHLSVSQPKAREIVEAIREKNWQDVISLLLAFKESTPPHAYR